MSDEMLVRVNEDDVKIGMVSRKEAHSNTNLIHREVGLLIVDKNGTEVMFAKRALSKSVLPGYWSTSVAGHVEVLNPGTEKEENEKPDVTILRETSEEIGYSITLDQLTYLGKEFATFDDEYRKESHFKYWYLLEVDDTKAFIERIVLQENEVEDVGFWSLKKIKEREENENFRLYKQFSQVAKMYLEKAENYLIQNEGDSHAKSYS